MKSLGLVLCCLSQCVGGQRKQPNIIFILADDLGWNDVSWHNPDMPTTAMERLTKGGVRLDQSYSQQVCTPSRAALLTGKYPFHIGRQKRALKPLQPSGLMLNLTTLPQELRGLGYSTHMVGKWHLGYCASEYTPTRRGFDTFLGFYLGSQNHFSHDRDYKTSPTDPPTFYDFRENEEVAREYEGQYSTIVFKERSEEIIRSVADSRDLNAYGNYKPFFLYLSLQATHAPLQARAEVMAKIPQSSNPARDIYKAMVYDVDMAVDEIVKTLKETNLYSDTIIVFTSDNGGAISHGASNYPLRGTKGTLFEGGTRVPTFVLGPPHLLPGTGLVSTALLHISDWMPTLLKVAGYQGDPSRDLQLDGVDQSEALLTGQSVRQEMVYNLKNNPLSGAYRKGPFKIIFGKKFNKQGWYDTDNTALQCSRMIKDKKSKRKEEESNSRPRRKKKKKKKAGSGRNSRVIELLTSRKIDKTLASGPAGSGKKERGDWRRRKRRREMMMRKKPKKRNNNKRGKNKSQGKKKRLGNTNQGKSFPKPKRNIRKKKGTGRGQQRTRNRFKIISEIFEDKHFELDFLRKLHSNAAEEKSSRSKKRTERRREKDESRIEKKFQKIWKDWLPRPGSDIQDQLRLRMEDCNWEDFSEQGHSDQLQLIPRSAFQYGEMVQIIDPLPLLNPFNISAADEDNEFDYEVTSRAMDEDLRLETKFSKLDIAMYNVIEDPEETTDLRQQFPEIFDELKRNVLKHIRNIVPEDFPPQDFSGHPRNFNGNFSPGWCSPK